MLRQCRNFPDATPRRDPWMKSVSAFARRSSCASKWKACPNRVSSSSAYSASLSRHEPFSRVSGSELIAALHKGGFQIVRVRGSHHFLRHQDGRTTVVPAHSGETIGPGLLHKILRDCQINVEDLQKLLKT